MIKKLSPYLYQVKTKGTSWWLSTNALRNVSIGIARYDCPVTERSTHSAIGPLTRGPMAEWEEIPVSPAKIVDELLSSLSDIRLPCVLPLPAPGNPCRYSSAQAQEGLSLEGPCVH